MYWSGWTAVSIHYLKPDTAIHTRGSFIPACGFYTGELMKSPKNWNRYPAVFTLQISHHNLIKHEIPLPLVSFKFRVTPGSSKKSIFQECSAFSCTSNKTTNAQNLPSNTIFFSSILNLSTPTVAKMKAEFILVCDCCLVLNYVFFQVCVSICQLLEKTAGASLSLRCSLVRSGNEWKRKQSSQWLINSNL